MENNKEYKAIGLNLKKTFVVFVNICLEPLNHNQKTGNIKDISQEFSF